MNKKPSNYSIIHPTALQVTPGAHPGSIVAKAKYSTFTGVPVSAYVAASANGDIVIHSISTPNDYGWSSIDYTIV